jgi:hypothetical protein
LSPRRSGSQEKTDKTEPLTQQRHNLKAPLKPKAASSEIPLHPNDFSDSLG